MAASHDPPGRIPGEAFSTARGRPMPGRRWWFWYLHHSKKVWFRISPPSRGSLQPLFRYGGRPILHTSQRSAWLQSRPPGSPEPVVWGDRVGTGFGAGPSGTTLYLQLWTRWTWLHPEACGRPERFSVEFVEPGTTLQASGESSTS
jgi:hypothetical protein